MMHQLRLGAAQPKWLYDLLEKTCRQRKSDLNKQESMWFSASFTQTNHFYFKAVHM